jgi:hypothetical protein
MDNVKKIMRIMILLVKSITILILMYIFYFLLKAVYSIIFTPSPCGYGFGSAIYRSRINYMKENLEINIPQNDIEILKFECSGFQDHMLEIHLLLTKQQTNSVINDFKKTYSKPLKKNKSVMYQDISDCMYQENISFSDDASRPTTASKYYDLLDISLKRDKNDFCILNLTLSTM